MRFPPGINWKPISVVLGMGITKSPAPYKSDVFTGMRELNATQNEEVIR